MWEPPLRQPLLISVKRLAEILDLNYENARGVAWCLAYRYVGRRVLVTWDSVEYYLEALEATDSHQQARELAAVKFHLEPWGLVPPSRSWGVTRVRRM